MAALEVAKWHPDEIGMGVACSELHSHKANKKELLAQPAKTRAPGRPTLAELAWEITLLGELRIRINAYCYSRADMSPLYHSPSK